MAAIIDTLYELLIDICSCIWIKEVGKHLILKACEMLLIELLKLHKTDFGLKNTDIIKL